MQTAVRLSCFGAAAAFLFAIFFQFFIPHRNVSFRLTCSSLQYDCNICLHASSYFTNMLFGLGLSVSGPLFFPVYRMTPPLRQVIFIINSGFFFVKTFFDKI